MRKTRLVPAVVVAAVVLFAGAASSADTLDVHLVSQNNSNITLGWTPQAGYGYLFSTQATSTAQLVLVSRTNDPGRSTVTFTKGSFAYEVAVIAKGSNGHYPASTPPPLAACSDGLDNDADGLVDYPNDPGCSSASDTDETNVVVPPPLAQCADGIDNDSDGLVDLADPGCSSSSDNDETNAAPPPTGYPDASNTGVPAGTTLTTYTGPSNITTANTVINGKTMGCIQISAPGVVIRNSRVSCNGGLAVFVDDRTSSSTLLTIEDSEVSCQNTGGTGISEADFIVRRVEITGCENGFDLNQNVLIEDSFIHDLFNSADAHADGAQMSGSHWTGSAYACCALNVTLRHNTIFGMGAPNDSSFGTSAIIQNGANGNNFDTNVTIDNNLLAGGAATLYCRTTGSSVNERITNNKFSTRFGPHVGAFFPASGCSDETVVSGNVYQETGLPVPMG